MKLFFEYSTDNPNYDTEHWVIIREEESKESKEDYLSPRNKIEASICIKMYPSDLCQFEVISASRGRDIDSKNHQPKDKFFLIIKNREQDRVLISYRSYSWDELILLMSKYKNMPFGTALKISGKDFYFRAR
ncbi:hypothetical protein RCC89_01595 [Cytophagaceae bacterium ABcell3]|nr:hypothetical protein RCC89_01595 [Cytophagaceae bacterium ABcell3]